MIAQKVARGGWSGTIEGLFSSKHPDAYTSTIDVFRMFEGKDPSIHPSCAGDAQKVARVVGGWATFGQAKACTPASARGSAGNALAA